MNNNAEINNLGRGSYAAQKFNSNKEQGPLSDLVKYLESEFQSNTLSSTAIGVILKKTRIYTTLILELSQTYINH